MAKAFGSLTPITLYTDKLHEHLHEELMIALNEYHKHHHNWVLFGRLSDSIRTRKSLMHIKEVCDEYRQIIANWRILFKDKKHEQKPIPRMVAKYKYRKRYK